MTDIRLDGWAVQADASGEPFTRLAYLSGPEDPEPALAVADAWSPPSPMALPVALCAALRAAAGGCEPIPVRGGGTYYLPDLDEALRAEVVDRFAAANAAWWNLDITRWEVRLKRYVVGDCHPRHTDLHPAGSATRKLAGTVQLSRPHEYDGGALVVEHWGQRHPMPAALGTVVVFPGWAVHEVEPVTRGERWVALVNGYGPPLR